MLEDQLSGARAIYAIEAHASQQRKQLDEFFAEIGSVAQTYKLSTGRLVSYAVQVNSAWTEILDEIAAAIRSHYDSTFYLNPADEVALEVISDLCRVTGSKMMPLPCCGICGKKELFPAATIVISGKGPHSIVRRYCSSCAADKCKQKTRDFVRALLDADRRNLKCLLEARLVRRKSRRDMAFTIAC
ncbi:MAG: hypothetical protein QHI38_00495 [Armatimonadota bacterium]|nr:hypothetical protein [Armatimonadota bacterium]